MHFELKKVISIKRVISKQTIRILLSLLGCIILLSLIFYYEPIDRLQRIRRKHEYNQAALEGARLAAGMPPGEYGIGIGQFTLEKLDNLKLCVPREYINYRPNEPNGKTDALSFSFFLPNMESRITMEKKLSHMDQEEMDALLHMLRISVFVSAQDKYIKCWHGQCLGPEFALFQIEMHFSRIPSVQKENSKLYLLQKGKHDPTLKLTAYKSTEEPSVFTGDVDVDTIYLQPNANPSNPKEWIHCRGHACHYYWFRDGLYIETTFTRTQLPLHAAIRKKIDAKIDEFIKKPMTS